MKAARWLTGAACLIAAAILGAVIGSRYVTGKQIVQSQTPTSVTFRSTPMHQIAASGQVEPMSEEFRVTSEIDGRLARVLVDEGDFVKPGQLVAQLENAAYTARVNLAESELAERQARLDRLRNGSRQEERREAENEVQSAKARNDSATVEVERRRPLLATGAVSRAEFDIAARDEAVASADLNAKSERLALVVQEARPEDERRAEAELTSARARLAEAQAFLNKTYIKTPVAGQVLRRWRKGGETVGGTAGSQIISVGDLRRLRVRVEVDETDVARVRLGQEAFVTAEAFPGKRFTGRVVRVSNVLGRKHVFTDAPTELVDKKVLEVLVELDSGQSLPVGLRVDAFLK